jgi:hypothetical protein
LKVDRIDFVMATKIGDCAYIYGITGGSVDCITLESKNEETVPEFEAEATDDDGNVAAVVRGPEKITFTLSGYTSAGCDLDSHECKVDVPTDGGGMRTCYVEKWSINRTNNDFAKCELTAVCYPSASVCCP